MRFFGRIIISSLAFLILAGVAWAQPDPPPCHVQPYSLTSGVHAGLELQMASPFRETVQVSGAPWLRLHFGDYNLGTQSFIRITSLSNGSQQVLDANSLPEWNDSSAFFNGDAVEVELYVAPGETGVFFSIEELTVGEWEGGGMMLESICGTVDNRVASTDPRVGRISGCTAWIASNGAFLAAGHCGVGAGVVEFNIPQSLADGTIVWADPDDQYPIDTGTIDFANNGLGDDWTVFGCNANSNTGLLPVQAQGAFYRMSKDYSTAGAYTIRITGCGVDGPPPNFGDGGPRNSDNRTLQTHTGPYEGESHPSGVKYYHKYEVDTMPANSGSPIILDGTTTSIGIHTTGGCNSEGYNAGCSFENDNLENALQTFPGSNVVYADVGHPVSSASEDGTVFRPYDTMTEAISVVPSNGIVSIVAGSYTKAAGNTFTVGADGKRMTFTASVGTVYIGN